MNQHARVSGTDMAAKSSKNGSILFKFDHAGFYTIEIPLPDGTVKIIKDVEVKRGRTTKLEIFIWGFYVALKSPLSILTYLSLKKAYWTRWFNRLFEF